MTKVITHSTTAMAAKRTSPRFKFISETLAELKKVVWMTRRELIYLTVLVLVVSGIAGLILAGLDYGFTRLIDAIFMRGG